MPIYTSDRPLTVGSQTRREFLQNATTAGLALAVAGTPALAAPSAMADYTLRIAPTSFEIAPGKIIQTIGYNGTVPGPLIRVRLGKQVTINVINDSSVPDLVHWHGLKIPSLVDGAMEEGTPMIMPGTAASYTFIPNPAGTRWYHTHATAKDDLRLSLYGGQYGFLYVEPKHDPGRYDQEVFIAMHQWEPSFVSMQDLHRGPPPDNGLEVAYKSASFNSKALGHGEPVRVRRGQRILFRLLNASATDDIALALPGHQFTVVALDGNPVPAPQSVDMLVLAPAERIDVVVEMNNPGVWVFGSVKDDERASGLGIVIEYANASGEAQWRAMEKSAMPMWDYLKFGANAPPREPDRRFELLSQKILGGRGGFNRWTINGKSWPDTDPLMVQRGKRYRLVFNNDSGDMHPMHLHRHSFELVKYDGKSTSGIIKDVVNVPARKTVEVDFVADNPGLTLLHCHMQEHMDFGFMNLVKYS
jgi:FtsP/CotA-like multicopper oxidase with cupredoxin domain